MRLGWWKSDSGLGKQPLTSLGISSHSAEQSPCPLSPGPPDAGLSQEVHDKAKGAALELLCEEHCLSLANKEEGLWI